MKKTQNSAHSYKKPALAVVILLFVAVIALGLTKHLPFQHTKLAPTAAEKQQASIDANNKKTFVQNSPTTSGKSGDSSSGNPQAITSATTNADNIHLKADRTDSSTVTVSTTLDGYSDGSCSLTVTNGSQTYTQTAQVIYQPQFSTCAGFSVPVSKLGTGTWQIVLTVTSQGNQLTKSTSLGVS